MIEKVLSNRNMKQACAHVVSNRGSAGVDGMTTITLNEHFRVQGGQLAASVREGSYHRKAILGVAIPKSNGKTRLLGIPTVEDRLLQQAVHQVMMPLFEVEFKAHSYGFRPKRNAQQAVQRAQHHINEDHCKLLQLLYRKVKCPTTLHLIRQWLRAPILVKGKLVKRRKGVPQGSPLSPLLSNIMLHELDRELEWKGLRYVRYADDFSIYLKSKREAKKVGNSIFLFLKKRLKLPINRAKSGIRRPLQFTLLGYGFVSTYVKGERGKYQLVAEEGSWRSLKQRLKAITRKTSPTTLGERIRQLKEVQRGWLNYFRMASMTGKLIAIDGWVRNRLRYCIWKHWKKPERRRKNLMRLGVDTDHAYAWSRTRKGGWAVAQSPILITTITLKRLAAKGYEAMLNHYKKVAPHLNEPLYTRPVRTVV
jgi:RNA-directed DNA polymerase